MPATAPPPHPSFSEALGFWIKLAIGAWLAMERFKIGVIPVLTVCALLGMVWKNL